MRSPPIHRVIHEQGLGIQFVKICTEKKNTGSKAAGGPIVCAHIRHMLDNKLTVSPSVRDPAYGRRRTQPTITYPPHHGNVMVMRVEAQYTRLRPGGVETSRLENIYRRTYVSCRRPSDI
ncbi:hypothetical protein EVAR_54087_1 [Eumeta japonica]|uniref:Uncharacterized protein n=1 Tax=Eumeta variegata TaxID=151549 RepID=A0A4C1XGD9_EUMVA|nr:hypothetical protein EVAR_54087_1 [Eumeta japonica]